MFAPEVADGFLAVATSDEQSYCLVAHPRGHDNNIVNAAGCTHNSA